MVYFAIVLGVLALGFAAYVRVAPTDPARWHVDPALAQDPGKGGVLRRHAMPGQPEVALADFDKIATNDPQARRIAGTLDENRLTYEVRTPILRFPDYVTVTALPTEGGAELVILSRLRFGSYDLGVNAKRLKDWLDRLDATHQ